MRTATIESPTYGRFDGERLLLCATDEPAPVQAERVHNAFRALVLDPELPCLGARSAISRCGYRFALYQEMEAPDSTRALARDLIRFVEERPSGEGQFTTFD